MSMMCRPMWSFLLMYGSHDMRHRFPQVDGGQRDPRDLGCHRIYVGKPYDKLYMQNCFLSCV